MAQFVCSACGYGSASWYGKCPSCGQWNTFASVAPENSGKKGKHKAEKIIITPLLSIKKRVGDRLSTDIWEFDRVLGGGFVAGEVVLLAGDPGVGKSTLLLSTLSKHRVLYISGEESGEQIADRAGRIVKDASRIDFSGSSSVDSIVASLSGKTVYDIVVIDSIQTMSTADLPSAAGSVSQIRESVSRLSDVAKEKNFVLVIVGHVTKEGDIAGPKTLEHLVDAVLYLEGERGSQFRILRSKKNRFGGTDEVGLFEMRQEGMMQIDKPTVFLQDHPHGQAGIAIVCVPEGSRMMFFEIQSLVVPTSLPVPRRVASGVDYNRLQLLLAVIKKHMRIALDSYDIYVSVVGGLTVRHPVADLGIVASVVSSMKNIHINPKIVFAGEVGLMGEVRKTLVEDKLIKEAKRFGFKTILTNANLSSVQKLPGIL